MDERIERVVRGSARRRRSSRFGSREDLQLIGIVVMALLAPLYLAFAVQYRPPAPPGGDGAARLVVPIVELTTTTSTLRGFGRDLTVIDAGAPSGNGATEPEGSRPESR